MTGYCEGSVRRVDFNGRERGVWFFFFFQAEDGIRDSDM